jgi:predicted Rossmann fold flavoprotein
MSTYALVVIGGGAAGFFAALSAKAANPSASVLLIEKTAVLLAKVRISGGGRCNVTHACFEPSELVKNYPRGSKELLGPFHRFQPSDTIKWFEARGVKLKTEQDGRMFPTTDQSQTIIDCLITEAAKIGVEIRLRQRIEAITPQEEGFSLTLQGGESLLCKALLLATGSNADGLAWAQSLGHSIQKPVPSLFTFNVPTSPLKELSGISLDPVELRLDSFVQRGPLLLTHFGFSGPAALKLSAWAARAFHEANYKIPLTINWVPAFSQEELFKQLLQLKERASPKATLSENPFHIPRKLWTKLIEPLGQNPLSHISHKQLQGIAQKLHADIYAIDGKTTHKEEFVTCGGITLKEVDFKTMQSKLCRGLYFAGEILDIDGVTGGFNFQNAWTTGFIAGQAGASLE